METLSSPSCQLRLGGWLSYLGLSHYNQEVGVEKDNENKMLVKPEQLKIRKIEKIKVIVEEVDLLEKVKQSKVKDNEIIKAVEDMKQAEVKMLRDEKQREVDGIMYKEEKVYVPRDKKLRVEIIWLYYDMPVGRHREQQKIVELVTRNFWWPGVTKEVKQYVEGYDTCQYNKNYTEQPVEKLMSNSILEKLWTHISADLSLSYHQYKDMIQFQQQSID